MPVQALTHAPVLREGAILNIMVTPQTRAAVPAVELQPGTVLKIRFGHCCPDIREATVAALPEPCAAPATRAVLRLNGVDWTIERDGSGVDVCGIVSENWSVRAGPES